LADIEMARPEQLVSPAGPSVVVLGPSGAPPSLGAEPALPVVLAPPAPPPAVPPPATPVVPEAPAVPLPAAPADAPAVPAPLDPAPEPDAPAAPLVFEAPPPEHADSATSSAATNPQRLSMRSS
jgi:hypothetical protein